MLREDMNEQEYTSICSVGYPIRGPRGQEEIHLGEKAPTPKAIKRCINGKLIGYGGDFEPGIDGDIIDCFLREFAQESGDETSHLSAHRKDVEEVARILIKNTVRPGILLHYLFIRNCRGVAISTREILNPGWYPARPLPDNILEADKLILPRVIQGERLRGWILYDENMKVIGHELASVESLA